MTCNPCEGILATEVAEQPDQRNLIMQRGTDNTLTATITDGDGRAVVITNDTVQLTVKTGVGGDLVFTKTNAPGSHSDPANGETQFEIDPADTAAASETARTYWVYDVRRIDVSAEERIHIRGDFTVEPTVS